MQIYPVMFKKKIPVNLSITIEFIHNKFNGLRVLYDHFEIGNIP